MIFVDTGAWYAHVIPGDPNFDSAIRWMRQNPGSLLTTDYVVDELLTLLRSRGHTDHALHLGRRIFQGAVCRLYYVTDSDIREAWHIFEQFSDKEWSFTDYTSRVVMERLGITTAFAFDDHFRQFGTVTVVP
jgi:predicted nucleic acid-binding protein